MILSSLLYLFGSSFMALFPVVNPIGTGFIVNGFFSGLTDEQRKPLIQKIIINSIMISLGALIVGHLVLSIFSLALPVVQLGGGFLICKTALGLLSSSPNSPDTTDQDKQGHTININTIESQIFYPISFPISVGPGTMSVIFTLMASANVEHHFARTLINYGVIMLVVCVMCGILYIFLSQGEKIMKRLGNAGNLVINKMVAFFTFCIGIQILLGGIEKIFHLHLDI